MDVQNDERRAVTVITARMSQNAGDRFGQLRFKYRFRFFEFEIYFVRVRYHAGLVFRAVALLRAGLHFNP